MNRHRRHRSPADIRPVFMFALALYVIVSFALAMVLGAAGASGEPLQPTPGLGL
jgi:hypothetical protein